MTEFAVPEVPIPPRPAFCRRCGRVVDVEASDCVCTAPASTPLAPQAAGGPSLRAALWLYFAMLGLSAATIVFVKAAHRGTLGARFDITLSFAFVAVVFPWALVYARSVAPRLLPRGQARWYLLACIAPVGTFALAEFTLWLFKMAVALPILDETRAYRLEGYGFGWVVLTTCLIPAIFEEIAFRGIIFDGLSKHLTTVETILVTAVIFGILHLSVLSLPHLLTIGVVLAILRAKTGSLLPGMLAHFLHNLLVCSKDWSGYHWPW